MWLFVCKCVSNQGLRYASWLIGQTHFFRIEILVGTWYVFGQRKAVEAFRNSSLDDLFEGVFGMTAKLTRVTVVRVWHTFGRTLGRLEN